MKKHQHKIAEKIKESKPLAGLRLYSLKTSVKKVVTIQGSLLAGRWFGGKNPMLAELTTAMLSEGTKERSKKEINEENRLKAIEITKQQKDIEEQKIKLEELDKGLKIAKDFMVISL